MGESASPEARHELLQEVYEESHRLTRLVENLLSITRLDAGVLVLDKQWFPLEDVVGSALGRLRNEARGRLITKRLAPDLPLVVLDGVLIEQVLFNLVDNALKYSLRGRLSISPPRPTTKKYWSASPTAARG